MERRPRKMQRNSVAEWSNLPELVIGNIVGFLKSYGVDHRRFRSVCRNWRNSSPSSTSFLNSDFPREIRIESGQPIHLISDVTYLFYPLQNHDLKMQKPWIMSVEEFDCKFKIRHPITSNRLEISDSDVVKPLNFVDFGSRIVDFGVKLRFANVDLEKSSSQIFSCEQIFFFVPRWKSYAAKTKSILLYPDLVVVLLLDQRGILGTLKINGECKLNVFCSDCIFDDIVEFKGRVCAVCPAGCAILINDVGGRGCPGSFSQKIKLSVPVAEFIGTRNRLVVHDGELYLVTRNSCEFGVFKLNEALYEWERVYSLGNKILFVTYDKCFFVETCYLPGCKGNCILFPKDCFPDHFRDCSNDVELFRGARKHLEVGVFSLEKDSCRLITSYPHLSRLFWPIPSWLLSTRFLREDEEIDCSYSGSESSSPRSVNQMSPAFAQHGENGQGASIPLPTSCLKATSLEEIPCEINDKDKSTPAMLSPRQLAENGSLGKNILGTDASLDLIPQERTSVELFQGVDVSSNLVPVLQKIWDKHGNIIEGHLVHSKGLLSWALESLANMIITLQTNTGDSLNDSQAEYLNSTLVDLKMMHFRLEWLAPFVEKALAIHKSKCEKRILMGLETRRTKLLEALHELEEKKVHLENTLADSLISSTPSVLKKSLAEGLC